MATLKENHELRAIFVPFLSTSHIIPLVDMARLFAMHGVDVTILTTSHNAKIFQKSIDLDFHRGRPIRTHPLKFPASDVGLPAGVEAINVDTPKDMIPKIYMGLAILQPEIENLFNQLNADFIVTDLFYPWTADAAAKLGIPRIMFHGASYLARSALHSVQHYQPHLKVESDSEKFVLPGLPHQLEMTPLQIPAWVRSPNDYTELMKTIMESEKRSYGSVFNSFYELEGDYYVHYKKVMGTKSWGLGPVSLWANHDASDKAARGQTKPESKEEGWLKWLNTKPENSVLYVSFGSMNKFPQSQLVEIAHALEGSGHDFIWVVRKNEEEGGGGGGGGGFLEEFEKRVRESGKGYLIWGWAPQLLILENTAIGGLVTHCGWNTVVESVNAGLPMATWPLFAEHFFNEKLVVDVLRIGVPVGAQEWRNWNEFGSEVVSREDIGNAIACLMDGGEEDAEMRRRAKKLSVEAKKAIEKLTLVPIPMDTKLKVIFLPFASTSHIIPIVDIARVLAMHGVDVTIIAPPVATSFFQSSVDGDSSLGRSIRTHVVKFPAAEVGLPDGVEIFNADTAPDMVAKIAKALQLLEKEIEKLFEQLQADCIVTDMFYPWTADTASRLGIPRLIFLGGSYLAHSAYHSVKT
ncbi:Soyasapogenol B glucuronide galactosyltransferase [Stylosanthes scabra]|uniref:Soyasapogenol B glucuronide galactosyltransferase n=1 Tax=Stylosanthes scabra TaxID=79078 RepID=A0ABU6QSZ2_9FABA|nr:Soyasapogenol B glucuronide galactosyltransferase [Stylosanthes scabra]